MAKFLEVLRGSVLCYKAGGDPVWHKAGEIFEAPAAHDHLISGDHPVCKVHVPPPVVVASEPEPAAAEAPAEPSPAKPGKK